ncbi:hypothetical protein [Plastoroseomonas hellenica]|nr:hypothetical protein [Plastoroseomonas hellenica]
MSAWPDPKRPETPGQLLFGGIGLVLVWWFLLYVAPLLLGDA